MSTKFQPSQFQPSLDTIVIPTTIQLMNEPEDDFFAHVKQYWIDHSVKRSCVTTVDSDFFFSPQNSKRNGWGDGGDSESDGSSEKSSDNGSEFNV